MYTYDASLDLEGVDFLTLSGGHDADAIAWSGFASTTASGRRAGRFQGRPVGLPC